MKYLKLYDAYYRKKTLKDFLDENNIKNTVSELDCFYQNITSLSGIEELVNLKKLNCWNNKIRSLSELRISIKLTYLNIGANSLRSLRGIENLINLEELYVFDNELKNLDELEDLPKIKNLDCKNNKWEYPLPLNLVKKFEITYTNENIETFKSANSQRAFLDKYPERVGELKQFGYHIDIINDEKYKYLIEQESDGYFNIRNK